MLLVEWVVAALALAIWSARYVLRGARLLHIFQLEEYLSRPYLAWLARHRRRHVSLKLGVLGSAITVVTAAGLWPTEISSIAVVLSFLVWGVVGFGDIERQRRWRAKKPLVFTPRARRLFAVAMLLGAVLAVGPAALGVASGAVGVRQGVAFLVVSTYLVVLLAGLLVPLASLVLYPLESLERRRFVRSAEAIMRERRPRIVAITGSAGKTTTKELLYFFLSPRLSVQRTPASYNTPLGIARVIRETLGTEELFIVEMGAYGRGDIRRLCEIVGPSEVAIITQINEQHLERFGSLENTVLAKFEIVDGRGEGGTAVLNFDNPHIRKRVAELPIAGPVVRYASDAYDGEVELRASGVESGPDGISFDVSWRGGDSVHFTSALRGEHNVGNILAATGAALTLGLDLEFIARWLPRFASPTHRLEVRTGADGLTIIDDAYNANPTGVLSALQVLQSYAPRRRFLVTPGIIELGAAHEEHNRRLGEAAAAACDVAILVGVKQTAPIAAGLRVSGFPEANLHVVKNLAAGREVIAAEAKPGDVILFANDLPDQYDEDFSAYA